MVPVQKYQGYQVQAAIAHFHHKGAVFQDTLSPCSSAAEGGGPFGLEMRTLHDPCQVPSDFATL